MKKTHHLEEHGRHKAIERYGDHATSQHGRSQMHRSVHNKFDDGGGVKPPLSPTPPNFDSAVPTGPDHDPWNMSLARQSGHDAIQRVRAQVGKYKGD